MPRTWHSGSTPPRDPTADHATDPDQPTAVREALASVVAGEDPAAICSFVSSDADFPSASKADAALDLGTELVLGKPRIARLLALAARRVGRRLADATLLARAVRLTGHVAFTGHRYSWADRLLRRAVAMHAGLGDEFGAASVRVTRAQVLVTLGRYAEARRLSEDARAPLVHAGGRRQLAMLEVALGNLAYRLDQLRDALRHQHRALDLLPSDAGPRAGAIVSLNIANALAGLRRSRAARRYFERARETFARHGPEAYLAEVDFNEGYAELLRGRFAAARRLLDRAAASFQAIPSPKSVASVDIDRADLHLQLGMPAPARAYARRALAELAGDELTKEQASATFFEAVAALLDGRAAEAELAFVGARERFVDETNEAWQARCELMCALAAERQGALGRARVVAEHALADLAGPGDPARAVTAQLLLVRLDLAEGRPEAARERLAAASRRVAGLETPWLHVELRRHRGLTDLARGELDSAIGHMEAAVRALERQRGHVPADEFMVAFMASKSLVYGELVDALARAGRDEEAFAYSERARSRALSDMLAGRAESGRAPRPHAELPRLLMARIEHLRGSLSEVYARLHQDPADPDPLGADRVGELRRNAALLEARLAPLLREARAHDPEFATLIAGDALDAVEIRKRLGGATTLLTYFVGPRGCHAFVVDRESVSRVALEVDAAFLAARVNDFRFHMSKFLVPGGFAARQGPLALRAARANLARLCDALLAPILDRLRTREVVIVPDGPLHALPFHALPLDAGWMTDHFDIAYAPSATVLGHCAVKGRRASGPATVLGVPDPLAPEIETEARAVAAALGGSTRLAVGAEATWDRLAASGDSRILHIASHGTYRRDEPTLSSIRLHDRWANLYDLYGLELSSELVTLSACETGVTHVGAARGLLGLVRGLFYAGAPRVLASRWRVDDTTTAHLMQSFYGAVQAGATYAAALRRAMADVREVSPNPYHWAPFFLLGLPGRGRADEPAPPA